MQALGQHTLPANSNNNAATTTYLNETLRITLYLNIIKSVKSTKRFQVPKQECLPGTGTY